MIVETFINFIRLTLYLIGSYDPLFFSYSINDGYSNLRYSVIGLDLTSTALLALVMLIEPTFIASFRRFFKMKEIEIEIEIEINMISTRLCLQHNSLFTRILSIN